MTTIAYRDGIMAADSQTTWGNMKRLKSAPKIHRINGCVVGVGGDACDGQRFIEWFAAGCEGPLKVKELVALVARPDGSVDYIDDQSKGKFEATPSDFFAVGSGHQFAMGAMLVGATAEQAVEAAASIDTGTGGPVITMAVLDG